MSDVTYELDAAGVLLLTLNRPEQMNTMGGTLVEDFSDAIRKASVDPAVRVVVVTGAGRAFCAGADLGGGNEAGHAPPDQSTTVALMEDLHRRWAGAAWSCPKPTIGLVNGAAAGAGMGLALTLDFRIAGTSALFVSAFSRIALSGDNGITHGLARLLGRSKALETLMLSPRIDAEEALRLGLVREVVPNEQLLERGLDFARQVAAGPVTVYGVMKRNLAFAETATFEQSLDREAVGIAISQSSSDFRNAVAAFLAKRTPTFG